MQALQTRVLASYSLHPNPGSGIAHYQGIGTALGGNLRVGSILGSRPLAEQERIVAAIEEQFSRLDAGRSAGAVGSTSGAFGLLSCTWQEGWRERLWRVCVCTGGMTRVAGWPS